MAPNNVMMAGGNKPAMSGSNAMMAGNQPVISSNNAMMAAGGGSAADTSPAADLSGGTAWINSQPLTVESLHGKVVLIDFWTYSSINCLRTLPYIKAWNEKYKDSGLVIIGVHTPEFPFEKDESNVRKTVRDLGVTYPVAMDNDYRIWLSSFRNWTASNDPAMISPSRSSRLQMKR
jgi:thiol-disulfide isomerase/thioredoxin